MKHVSDEMRFNKKNFFNFTIKKCISCLSEILYLGYFYANLGLAILLSLVKSKSFSKYRNLEGYAGFVIRFSSAQFSSVVQSCPTLCDSMNLSMPGLIVHHQLPEFTQTQVHRVSDAIQPSHPLSSPSPPAPNPSQHQSLFQ